MPVSVERRGKAILHRYQERRGVEFFEDRRVVVGFATQQHRGVRGREPIAKSDQWNSTVRETRNRDSVLLPGLEFVLVGLDQAHCCAGDIQNVGERHTDAPGADDIDVHI